MKTAADLANQLLEIPDVKAQGQAKLFVSGNREIARLREDGFIEIRLTRTMIRALNLTEHETTADWVQMDTRDSATAVLALVQRAAHIAQVLEKVAS